MKYFGVYLNILNVQEIKSEVNLGTSPRQLPVDPSTVYGQGILQSKPGMGNAGKYVQCNAYRNIHSPKIKWWSILVACLL